jgi:hypothetical protein
LGQAPRARGMGWLRSAPDDLLQRRHGQSAIVDPTPARASGDLRKRHAAHTRVSGRPVAAGAPSPWPERSRGTVQQRRRHTSREACRALALDLFVASSGSGVVRPRFTPPTAARCPALGLARFAARPLIYCGSCQPPRPTAPYAAPMLPPRRDWGGRNARQSLATASLCPCLACAVDDAARWKATPQFVYNQRGDVGGSRGRAAVQVGEGCREFELRQRGLFVRSSTASQPSIGGGRHARGKAGLVARRAV